MTLPLCIVLDRNGGTWADCLEEQGADELESGVYGKAANGWRYDTATNTLYLNNAAIDCSSADADGTCISAADDLNIVLVGESTLKSKTGIARGTSFVTAVLYSGNLNISGTGTLNIEEGNYTFRQTSNECQLTVDGGVINIIHDFENYDTEGASTNIVIGSNNKNTVVNDGQINSDVNFAVKEINGGEINAYGVINKGELTINSGEINANTVYASNKLTINGGVVNVSGGNINTFISDYIAGYTNFGIFAVEAFEMNGGEVYTHGSAFGLLCAQSSFNGGSFVAESEGAAVVTTTVVSSGVEPSINISDSVKITEPESYVINSVQIENGVFDFDAVTNIVSIYDASVEEPNFEFDNATWTVSTNAAKRVVIKEYWDYSISADIESLDFGTVCYDSKNKTYVPAAVEVTLTNTGNRPVYIHPWSYPASDNAFGFIRQSDFPESKSLQPGESITYSVKPREELKPGNYEGYIEFPTSPRMFASGFQYRLQIPVSYVVNNHEYGEYVSNNDATYDSDGTKTHVCALCGKKQTVWDKGTKLIRNGWFNIENAWYYYIEDEAQTGWLKDGGKWYFLDEDGVMQTGWIKDGSTWYYLNKSGAMATGWQQVGGKWYYLNSNGAMQTGWLKDGNNWYYLKSNGSMATGWIKDGGKWYYLKSSGAMATGWIKDGGKWYYLESNGAMRTANLSYKGKVYKFNSSGACINP